MDYQRDYILRLIHMLGDLMRRIFELLDDKQRVRLLSDACREHCGMPLETAEALDTESLISLLASMPRFMAAELLCAKAEVTSLPIGEAEELKYKGLRLLASLYAETQLCELRAEKLATLKREVFPLLTGADLMDCGRFFWQAERYDEMEDALFQALEGETGEQRERDRREAIGLLRNAANATEHTLALCRMTASELRASARELETLNLSHERETER